MLDKLVEEIGNQSINIHTVIIKVTNDCNMDCHYCYLEDSVPRKVVISYETISKLLGELVLYSSQPVIHLTWHGGEPMLAGIDFYRKVVEIQKTFFNKRFINAIKTNGLYINEEFADFFKENEFLVGISIDGPQRIHDSVRKTKNGKGTFNKILQNVNLLKAKQVSVGALVTVARHNIDSASELYDFFKKIDLSTTFSVIFPSGKAQKNSKDQLISPSEYSRFLVEIAERWLEDGHPTSMRTIELIIFNLVAERRKGCTCIFSSRCFESFIAIGPLGDLYPCCLFQGFEDFKYGNIHEISINQIPNTSTWKSLEKRVRYINVACSKCEIKEYCNGGCAFNSLVTKGTILNKDFYCSAYKKAFPIILEKLEAFVNVIH